MLCPGQNSLVSPAVGDGDGNYAAAAPHSRKRLVGCAQDWQGPGHAAGQRRSQSTSPGTRHAAVQEESCGVKAIPRASPTEMQPPRSALSTDSPVLRYSSTPLVHANGDCKCYPAESARRWNVQRKAGAMAAPHGSDCTATQEWRAQFQYVVTYSARQLCPNAYFHTKGDHVTTWKRRAQRRGRMGCDNWAAASREQAAPPHVALAS